MNRNRFKIAQVALALMATGGLFAEDLTAQLEFIGNPQLERWPNNATARACLDLQFYQGRLFNGGGEVESNPGAPWISSVDPFDNSIRFEFAPGTEAIANYRIASWGDLMTSAQDPHEGDANIGHVFTRSPDGAWTIFKSVGGSLKSSGSSNVANNTHCWDMDEFDGRVFVAGYNLMASTDRCKTFTAATDLTSAYVSIDYATSAKRTATDSHLRRQIQLLRFGNTALFAVPNTLLQPNVMSDTRTCNQEVFRYNASTHAFETISQRASDIYPGLSSADYQLVGRNLTYFSSDTYARTLARIWHTTPFKDRVLYIGCYDTPPYSSVVSPWEDKIALTSYPLPLMGCSAAVVDNQIKATRISFGGDKTNYPWDFAVVGDTVYALTSRYVADGQKNRHIVWKSTDGVNFTKVLAFDFHQNFISLEYRDGWFYFGCGCKDATKGYTYDKTADESGSIYRVRCPQEPIQVVSSVDTLALAEGATAKVAFHLSAPPAGELTLRVGAVQSNPRFTTDKTSLTFTPENWKEPQEVTVAVSGNGTLDANRVGAVVCGADGFDGQRGEFCSSEVTAGVVGATFIDAELVPPANGEIRTADDFYCAMSKPDGDYKLMNDIDLDGSLFTTIDEFTGTLDGNGFTLFGLGDGPLAKRFSGVVKNLTLDGEGAVVTGLSRGLYFDEADGGAFSNCTVKGYTLKAASSDAFLGLFVGVATGSVSFCRCSTDAECLLNQANQHDTSLGGFVAKVALPSEGGACIVFEGCTNCAAIAATDNYRTTSGAGGFVGVVNGTLPTTPTNEVRFVRSANEGTITSAGRNNCLGGLVGRFNATLNKKTAVDTRFILCANEGDITVPENGTQSGSAGGFTGNVGSSNNIIFSQCTSTGTITAPAVLTTGLFAAVGETTTDDTLAEEYPEPQGEGEGLNSIDAPEGDRFTLPLKQTWPGEEYGAEVCLWQYDRYAALSFGHDDNCDWDIPFLLREAKRNGIRLTWWLITKNIGETGSTSGSGNWPEWREAFAAGHAIESHSHTHEWASGGRTVPDAAAAAGMSVEDYVEFCMYSNSLAVIREHIPGCRPSTLAFPGGEQYAELVKRYFVSGRTTSPYINRANAIDYLNVSASSGGIDPGYVNVLLGGRGGSKALAGWKGSFNDAKNYRGWFVPFLHTEQTHDGLPNAGHEQGVALQIQRMALLGRHRRHLWLGTYPAVAKYGQSRDTATLTVKTKTAAKISFVLKDRMRDDWYDEPLTVKVRLPSGWAQAGVAAAQNGKTLDAFYLEREGAKYALVNAVPDRGEVTLVPAAANSGTWDETSYAPPTYTYQVRFYDEDGATLLKTVVAHPVATSAADEAPVVYRPGYRLSWTTKDGVALGDITDDVDFTATWTATDEKPKAVFVDESGETLTTVETVYGARPAQPTDLPVREGYIAYWEPELKPLVENATYTVRYLVDDDPIDGAIIVRTAEEFCDAMAKHPDGTIRMVRDIDLTGCGYTATPDFSGTFKAYGHVLAGLGAESLCVTNSGTFAGLKVLGDSDGEHPVLANDYGVFAVVSAGGRFTDCRVDGYAIRADAQNVRYGVFVATATEGTVFSNCTVGATCSINQGSKPNNEIGGFVGELKVTEASQTLIAFVNCVNEAQILATGDYNTAHGDGGFIGRATGCGAAATPEILFVNCDGTGLVSSSGGNANLGGYIGYMPGLTAKATCKVTIEGGTATMPVGEKANSVGEWIGSAANVVVEHRTYVPPEPPPEEPPVEPTAGSRPVARWDVVPYQRFDGVFKAGVVAFHEDGVKVTFRYADKEFVAANPAYNDRVKVWEYFVPIDAAALADGEITVTATATTLGATPVSFELAPLTLYANHGGTVGSTKATTIGPADSVKDALALVGDGGTVYLKAGTYSLNGFGGKTGRRYWTTLRPAEGVKRGEVKFSAGRPGMDKFRLKDILLYTDADGYSAIVNGENGSTVCWLDNCKFTCVGGRYRGNSNLFGNKMGGFVTGGVTEGMNNGPDGSLIRDHYVHSIAADTWTGSDRLVVNCHVDDVDPGNSGAHPDFFQSHAVEPDWCHDVILYNVTGWDCKSQGLFGWRLKDAAFVNIVFQLGGGAYTSQFSGDLDNVLFAHLTLVDQTWNWREGFAPKDVRSVNGVYGNMIVYDPETMKTDGSTGLTVAHNAFYGKKTKTSAAQSDWGLNDVAIGREFSDEANHDYALADGSAGLANGIPLQCVPADVNGNRYPSGARPCGAYTTSALATAAARIWTDDWDESAGGSEAEREIVDWFNVEFGDAGYQPGADWTRVSVDKSGGMWSGDDNGQTVLDAATRRVTIDGEFRGVLAYTPKEASEIGVDVVLTGCALAEPAERTAKPAAVPFAFTFEDVDSRVFPLVYAGGDWHRFGKDGFAASSWVEWKVEFDYSSESAPRVRMTVGAETSDWLALAMSGRQIAGIGFAGGTFGDFRARVLKMPGGGEVIELVTPEFAKDGGGAGLAVRESEDGSAKQVFALNIANPVKGAYYTVFTTTDLTQPFFSEGKSVQWLDDGGALTLDVPADGPSKFATVVISLEPIAEGTPLLSEEVGTKR